MKKLFYILILLCGGINLHAQVRAEEAAPKWTAKAQKAVVSVLTYDQKKELLHSGTGAFIQSDGTAIAPYSLFRGAYSAQVVDMSGNKYPVERILGASDTYGMVKFKTAHRKAPALDLPATSAGTDGGKVYALGYSKIKPAVCPATTILKKDMVEGNYAYYTLAQPLDSKHEGDVLFDANGQLAGLVLPSIGGKGYAIDARLSAELNIKAIQSKLSGLALQNIHMPKALPDTPEEALVYLYFQSRTAGNDEYLDMLNLFVSTYPSNAEGYYRRATPLLDLHRFDDAAADLDTYLKLAADKMVAHSNVAQTITSKLLYQPEPAYDKWNFDLALDHVNQALALAGQRCAQAATDSMRQMAEADLLEYKLQKAQVLMGKKDDRGAIEIYDEINAGPYRSATTFLAASLAHEAAGDSLSEQIAMMDSAIACFYQPLPRDAANYVMRRAKLLAAANLYRKSVLDFNTYATLMGSQLNDAFYYDRAMVELDGRMFQQALDDLDEAIRQNPKESLYYVEKSAILLRVNELDKCVEAARQCIELDQSNSDAFRILGYALLQKGDKNGARKNLEQAKALGDDSAEKIIQEYLETGTKK